MSDEPKFGARAGDTNGQYGAPDDLQARPYDGAGRQGGAAMRPDTATGQQGQYGQPEQIRSSSPYATNGTPAQSAQDGCPGATGQPHYGGGRYPNYPGANGGNPGGAQPRRQLPGRGWPVTLIVLGVVMMIIIAPVTAIVSVTSSIVDSDSFQQLRSSAISAQLKRSDTKAVVDGNGSYMVMMIGDHSGGKCELIPANGGDPIQASAQNATKAGAVNSSEVFVFENLDAGDYKIACTDKNGPVETGVVGMSSAQQREILSSFASGLLIPTIVGIAGLIILIIGIVWLVRVNRRRREVMMGTIS